jgi:hypothetical protein
MSSIQSTCLGYMIQIIQSSMTGMQKARVRGEEQRCSGLLDLDSGSGRASSVLQLRSLNKRFSTCLDTVRGSDHRLGARMVLLKSYQGSS